jgi:DNA gyrase subunit A
MATANGTVKKTLLSEFESVRANGKIAINLHDDDSLISAKITDGSNDIILASNAGLACRFRESDVRPMGRTAAGVIGMQLGDTERIISMVSIKRPDSQIIVVGERGYGKRTNYEDFRLTKRGAKGVISMNITDKTGEVVSIMEVQDTEDLVVMTVGGILIRQQVKDIRIIGRNTQGVRLIRLEEGDKIADITTVPHEEDEDETDTVEGNEIITPTNSDQLELL